jgi:hypothetical protein
MEFLLEGKGLMRIVKVSFCNGQNAIASLDYLYPLYYKKDMYKLGV